jgi:glycyl-tRNA synthetase beta chain
MDRPDDPEGLVRAGNEWVVAARLADARFFLEEDRKLSLEQRRPDLERLTFHARLGSYSDKAERIVRVSEVLCDALGWEEAKEPAARAAELLKVDLTTEMVKEFTSLQGIMGGVYARRDGQPEEIWQAVYDQYLPAGGDDPIPRGRVGSVLGLADRIDTLIGIIGLGMMPTGSRDPFGLRRAAQGIVRIALEGDMALDLDLVAAKAHQFYGDALELRGKDVLAFWRQFLFDRVRYLLGREGYAYDEIEAGLAVGGSNLPDLRARVSALHEMREEPDFLAVVLAAKRIANIVKEAPEAALDEELLTEPAEKALFEAYKGLRLEVDEAESAGNYERCLRAISGFADVLDRFFVEVLVMDENRDLRDNRIALLQSIQRVLSRTAGPTEMVVDRSDLRERAS